MRTWRRMVKMNTRHGDLSRSFISPSPTRQGGPFLSSS
jgi:hypothetical protein